MIRLEHDWNEVSADTMRALVGKQHAYIVDVVVEQLAHRKESFKMLMDLHSNGSIKYVVISTSGQLGDSNQRYEHIISMSIGKNEKSTNASKMFYTDQLKLSNQRVIFHDWTVPNAKKLREIIYRVF